MGGRARALMDAIIFMEEERGGKAGRTLQNLEAHRK